MIRKIEVRTYETLAVLDSVGQSWARNEELIDRDADDEVKVSGPKWQPSDDEELGEYYMEVGITRHLHDMIMTPMHRYSCIVMLYTTIERELRRLVENLEKERGQQKLKLNDIRGQSFLAQVTKFINVFFGCNLTDCPRYGALSDLQKIRDCIIHCRGEVSLSRDKDYLIGLKGRCPGFSAYEWTDIEIEPECIEHFIRETWAFFVWVFAELNWKVDDHWHKKNWSQPVQAANHSESSQQ
jgi:hypothetical protein